jgi:hypothetical protein
MRTRIFLILSLLTVLLFVPSCEKKINDNLDNILISVRTPLEVSPGAVVRSTFFSGRGPLITDKIRLDPQGGGASYVFPISELGDDYFTFTIGDDFKSGTYDFILVRGSQEKKIGTVVYTFIVDTDLKPDPGATVYGIVSCDGAGVAGVPVSDGYNIVVTNADGIFQLPSKKENGYVFITIPSGYEVQSTGILPQFYHYTRQAAASPERMDFTLYPAGDQTNHVMLFFGDMHLAGGKQSDRTQFARFTADVNAFLSANPSKKVYGLTLGDMTWDIYWYSKNYCFEQYLIDINAIKGMQVFQCIGNHDHDMNATGDWDTAVRYKTDLGPNYYSFNIGKVHYVVLDNILCTNSTPSTTNGDYRSYLEKVNPDGIAWLRKDLTHVSKSTPVIVAMHAPLYNQNGGPALENANELTGCFSGFQNVRFLTGHSHKIWNIDSGSIHENNTGAVCGAWWWAGYYNANVNVAHDGAPARYLLMEVKFTQTNSYFKATGKDANLQFRTYDRNSIRINPADYGVSTYASECSAYLTQYGKYNTVSTANEVLINVWDYDKTWKVDVTENGNKLDVSAVTVYDPLYIISYPVLRFKSTTSVSFNPFATNHMFKVTASSPTSTLEIKVTDDEGKTYTETMTRPKSFSVAAYE